MNTKFSSILFLLVCGLSSLVTIGLLYAYDPLSIFHLPLGRDFTVNIASQRQQQIAFIKHFPHDSVIFGNSHTENTSCKEAESAFGGKFLNLSMGGAGLYEQSVIRDYLLRHREIKTVFSVLPPSHLRVGHGDYPLEAWDYLYDDNPFNDLRVYLNSHYLMCLSTWNTSPHCVGYYRDIDRPAEWYTSEFHNSRFGGLDNWIKHSSNYQITPILYDIIPNAAKQVPLPLTPLEASTTEAIDSFIEDYIVAPAKEFPKTQFIYFFSPSSLLDYAIGIRNGSLNGYSYWLATTVAHCHSLPNVKIFGFDNEDFTSDLAYYKDLIHYRPEINSLILNSIKKDKGLLTPENIQEYIAKLYARAKDYDILSLNTYIQVKLAEQKLISLPQNKKEASFH